MADKGQAVASGAPAKKGGGKLSLIIFMLFFGFAAPFIVPTIALILLGMMPTLAAFIADSDRHQSSATAVAYMNAAGLSPFLIDLWEKGQSWEHVSAIMHEPGNWLVIFGAAGVGYLIVYAVPQALTSLTFARAEVRMKIMKENLEKLKTTWGPDVASTKPLDRISKVD